MSVMECYILKSIKVVNINISISLIFTIKRKAKIDTDFRTAQKAKNVLTLHTVEKNTKIFKDGVCLDW